MTEDCPALTAALLLSAAQGWGFQGFEVSQKTFTLKVYNKIIPFRVLQPTPLPFRKLLKSKIYERFSASIQRALPTDKKFL